MNMTPALALVVAPDGTVEAASRLGGTGLSFGPAAGRFLAADPGRFL